MVLRSDAARILAGEVPVQHTARDITLRASANALATGKDRYVLRDRKCSGFDIRKRDIERLGRELSVGVPSIFADGLQTQSTRPAH